VEQACFGHGPDDRLAIMGIRAYRLLLLPCAALAAAGALADDASRFAERRARMVSVIERYAESAPEAVPGGKLDPRVIEVMGRVPRHEFVRQDLQGQAYADRPLPIGYGQTISQPFIVALMTDLLRVEPDHVVLEIGTGSGYQAAVLAELAARVCTIEIIPGLAQSAAERLARLGYGAVETRSGDGYYGWPECGPFDGIVVTAAASHIPPPLLAQLKPGGRMAIPVGGPYTTQQLVLVTKDTTGQARTRRLLPVQFVPFTRHGE